MLAQLRRNLVLLYAAETLGKILGLVVFGYLARVLLAARYGDLEFALGILFLLNLVIDAGLGHYGARETAKRPAETDRLVAQVAMVRGGLVVISLVLLAAVALALPRDPLARSLIVLQGLVLLPAPFVLSWVFQARDEMHVVSMASVIRQVVMAVGVLLLVRSPDDVWQVPLWDAVGLGLAVGLQVLLFTRAGGSINPFRFVAGIRTVVVESAPLAGSSVVWAIRLFAPLLALGLFTTSADVGVFGAGHRLVIAVHTFVWLYFFNLLPTLSRLGTDPQLTGFQDVFTTSMRLVGWVALCGASIGAALAPVLIPLVYGDGLAVAADSFQVMVWVLAAAFVSGHHRFGLIALSRQNAEFSASIAGALVSVGGCLALGSRLTPVAAAWIFVAAETTTLIAASVLLGRSVPQLRVVAGLARPLVFTGTAGLLLRLWSPASPLVAAAALVVVYLAGIAVLERDGLRRLLTFRSALEAR
ncbi:MAG: oligosaccharide flippase family protein [Longimicrobiales bacterium]